ncbi:MAG: sulfotransferase family 2 domain-containing protein [Planctomycetota bacterium]
MISSINRGIHEIYRNRVPWVWQQRIDLLRGESQLFLPCMKEAGCIFIHVPKAAGTSISHSLYGRNVGHRKAKFYHQVSKREFRKYFSFGFVRNPWDRALSAYRFVMQGGTAIVKPQAHRRYNSEAFSSFEKFVTAWLGEVELNHRVDAVFLPQCDFLMDQDGNQLVDFVGKIESMEDGIRVVESRLGRALEVPKLNASREKSDYREYYSGETMDIVARVYQRDIDLFDYSF